MTDWLLSRIKTRGCIARLNCINQLNHASENSKWANWLIGERELCHGHRGAGGHIPDSNIYCVARQVKLSRNRSKGNVLALLP